MYEVNFVPIFYMVSSFCVSYINTAVSMVGAKSIDIAGVPTQHGCGLTPYPTAAGQFTRGLLEGLVGPTNMLYNNYKGISVAADMLYISLELQANWLTAKI